MDLKSTFAYTPVNPTPGPPPTPAPDDGDLGPLKDLVGTWSGAGFNAIWRPSNHAQDRFLELNETIETIQFEAIPGVIPNRGLLQADLEMVGVRYLQQISDKNQLDEAGHPAGLHIEPGIWLSIPATSDPQVPQSIARLASIPHGTSIVAQGVATTALSAPTIEPVSLNPFPVGNPAGASPFAEQNLGQPTEFRTQVLGGITQPVVDNPTSLLTEALTSKSVTSTTALQVTTDPTPILGGGTANTAFLAGGPDGPNAQAISVTATFWIEALSDGGLQLQYTQTVQLKFNGLSWPHVTVGTLTKQPPMAASH